MTYRRRNYKSDRYEFEHDSVDYSESNAQSELRLDTRHKKIGGVCAGIANYFNIQAVFVRAVTVIALIIAGQAVLIAYGLAYLILDDA